MISQVYILIAAAAVMFSVIGGLSLLAHYYTLNGIKSRTVGDGQHGTARFATKNEIKSTYKHIPFKPKEWRRGIALPQVNQQGLILGSTGKKNELTALVDTDDVHCLMIGASGVGKTAFFLYPNLEYACASGMSFLTTDTKGDLYRNYGAIARDHYGYHVAVIDLRNPTRSDGNNMLHLVNKYMDAHRADENNLVAKAKAEKYAKIIAKTIINAGSENYGQNQFFYDAAEGLLTAVILLIAEYLPPTKNEDGSTTDCRHIISVFKLVQDLLAPSKVKGKSQFQLLMDKLPSDHKARWFAGAALPAIDSLELIFSASRSRRLTMVPIIQSFGQLEKNYGKEGSEIIVDNCQDTIFGGFAPNSQTAEVLSKAMGSRTVMSGSISRGKNDPSQSLQMMERPLMTADELKSIPKGNFVVMKTGTHPMKTKLRLFLDWGITFDSVYTVAERAHRKVTYADKQILEENIMRRHAAFIAIDTESGELLEEVSGTGTLHTPVTEPQTNTSKRRTHVRTS